MGRNTDLVDDVGDHGFDAVFVEAIDAIDNGQIDLLDKNNPVLKVNEQLEVFNLKKT